MRVLFCSWCGGELDGNDIGLLIAEYGCVPADEQLCTDCLSDKLESLEK